MAIKSASLSFSLSVAFFADIARKTVLGLDTLEAAFGAAGAVGITVLAVGKESSVHTARALVDVVAGRTVVGTRQASPVIDVESVHAGETVASHVAGLAVGRTLGTLSSLEVIWTKSIIAESTVPRLSRRIVELCLAVIDVGRVCFESKIPAPGQTSNLL